MIINAGTDTRQKTIVIIGVQRGGTSMVAGVVRELGINLGRNLGNNHEDPKFVTKELDKIRANLDVRNKADDIWGWKMPHTSEYLLELLPEIRNPFIIVVFRNLLSMVESQMKRSEADFENAYEFSYNRLMQVGSIISEIECPLMLVNYEKAIAKPDMLINEVVEFLHIEDDPTRRDRAIDMINPEIGYRRMSREQWKYTLSKSESRQDDPKGEDLRQHRKNVNLIPKENRLFKAADKKAYVEFSEIDAKCLNLFVTREGKADTIRVVLDVGSGFSNNMGENISLYKGRNLIAIKAEAIQGLRIYPQFDGPWSNTKLYQLYKID